jgi:hypothetical protein
LLMLLVPVLLLRLLLLLLLLQLLHGRPGSKSLSMLHGQWPFRGSLIPGTIYPGCTNMLSSCSC